MIENQILVDQQPLTYWEAGKGQTVVFLHGWGGSKDSWLSLSRHFDLRKFHLIAIDLPGFGESPVPNSAWQVTDYAENIDQAIRKWIKEGKIKGKVVLCVHSFGGRLAIELAARKSDYLKSVILIAAAGASVRKQQKLSFWAATAKLANSIVSRPPLRIFQPILRKVLYKFLGSYDYQKTSGKMREIFQNTIAYDQTELLKEIKVPALIIWGNQDTYVPVADAGRMHALIPNSELKIIQGGRHGIHLKYSKQIAEWIVKFLENHHE